MFENNNTCKYLIIALIIALLIMVYLYFQKKRAIGVEGMTNIDYPWAEPNEVQFRSVTNKLNQPNRNYIKRKDELFEKYMKKNDTENLDLEQKPKKNISTNIPQPMDDRPDLSQCQPCICDKDSDSESDIIYVKSKKNKSKKNRRNLY